MKRVSFLILFCMTACVHDTRQDVIAGIVASAAGTKSSLLTWATACEQAAVKNATSHTDGEARLAKCRTVESKLSLDIHTLIDAARAANAANNGQLDTLLAAALKLADDISALGATP